MSNDLYKTVNYNDGEGITHGDLNDGQRFLASRLSEQVIERLIGNPTSIDPDSEAQATINVSTAWAYCLTVGGAHFKPTNDFGDPDQHQFTITPGTVFQKIGNATGDEPSILSYTFDGTTVISIAAGHATLARVDMLQMKLEYEDRDSQSRDFKDGTTGVITSNSMNKKRQVKATISWKTGTAAANPAYPSPDAGYVPLMCAVIDNNYIVATTNPLGYSEGSLTGPGATTGNARAAIHDLRMPVNFKSHEVSEWGFDVVQWTKNAAPLWGVDNLALTGAHPTNKLYGYCPVRKGRIVGIGISTGGDSATPVGANEIHLTSVYSGGAGFLANLANLSAHGNIGNIASGSCSNIPMSDLEVADTTVTNSITANITVTGNGTHKPPVWGNGWRGWMENTKGIPNFWGYLWATRLAVSFVPRTGATHRSLTFYVAEGM